MMKKNFLLLLSVGILLFTSCDNFDAEQQIPAYIRIQGFKLIENTAWQEPQTEGFLSSNIVDAWITIGSDSIQCFPLKEDGCLIPVLRKGKNKVTIEAGILLNGIKGTHIPYSFYKPYTIELNLVEDSIIDLGIVPVMYNNNYAQVPFNEEFEQSYLGFRNVELDTTEHVFKIDNVDSVKFGMYCGAMYRNNTDADYKVLSSDSIFVSSTQECYLEIDYHSNIPVSIGVYGKLSGSAQYESIPVITLNPNEAKGWTKVYIVLTKGLQNFYNYLGFYFNLYIQPTNPGKVTNGWVHFDNVKIIHP